MSAPGGHHRKRRLVGAVGALALLAAIGTPNALADTGLGSLDQVTESATPAPLPALDVTPAAVAPVVETATKVTEPVPSTVEPVVESAPVVEVEKTVAPVLAPVNKVAETSTEKVDDALAPVVESVQETTRGTLGSVATTTAPLTTGPGLSNTRGKAAGDVGETVRTTTGASVAPSGSVAASELAGGATSTVATSTVAASGTAALDAPTFAPPTRRAIKDSATRADASAPAITLLSAPTTNAAQSSPAAGAAMPSSQPHAPLPDIPSGPLTALFSASASVGGGALVLLLAALAAATLLAAPGVGRRLRPTLAPWPQPIPHLSLERPG